MIQMRLINQKKKQEEGVKLHVNIRQELEGKKCLKTFFQVLEKQNLQNQTMSELFTDDDKQKYSRNPSDIFKPAKKIMKHFTPMKQLPKRLLLNFLAKFLTKKISNEQFNLYEAKISLHESIKSMNSLTMNLQVTVALQQNLINTFLMNQFLSFQMFMTPEESLAPWVLLLEKESYLSYTKDVIKQILQTTDLYTAILKNRLEKRLDTIVGENQPAAIKKQDNFAYFNNTFNNFTFYYS